MIKLIIVITEYIRYRIPADLADAFEADYARAVEELKTAPQCHDFELSRCLDDPASYLLRINWSSVEDHLQGFCGGTQFAPFFDAIGRYVDAIEETRHYRTTSIAGTGGAVPSIYQWAGGIDAFRRLTAAFYLKVPQDPILAPIFADMPPDHSLHVADWLAEVFGGPTTYSSERGGHRAMARHHLGRALTEEQRHRWVELLLQTADEVGLPADPEFRAAFVGYLEWGSRMAIILSAPGAEVALDEPMPTWSWQLPPWTPKSADQDPAPRS
ncbi:MAG TPA: antibiotic biosynthesis monooxygenase [Microlunatus sp.]